MPSLAELHGKWFLGFGRGDAAFPPSRRHPGGVPIANFTEGNLVTVLIDGEKYMRTWRESIERMHAVAGAEVYHAGWILDNVFTGGADNPRTAAYDVLSSAVAAGVDVRMMLSRHCFMVVSYPNVRSSQELISRGVRAACLDNRFPPLGSNHTKMVCLKNPIAPTVILGSIDIASWRWDTVEHKAKDVRRHPRWGSQTHDLGVQIEGPAVGDLERSFTERWNDPTRTLGLQPLTLRQPLIVAPPSAPSRKGPHSIQVLRTYGIANKFWAYSWSPRGEFTVWASYINALKKARRYIYIEDQFLFAFGYPPVFQFGGKAAEADIIWQLGEAIKRGVKVAVLVPSRGEPNDPTFVNQQHQRDLGVFYLENTAVDHGTAGGKFFAASLEVGSSSVYVHSKLLIVDDEFVLVGSANVGQRSMTCDTELSVAIVDAENAFAQSLRVQLWAEHLERSASTLGDPIVGYEMFREDAFARRGRVRYYPPSTANRDLPSHGWRMRKIVDPYEGPLGGDSGRIGLVPLSESSRR